MIRFQYMKWSNVMSYGPDNYINFENNQLTQIVGENGAGKSSISVILEEGLFSKNSRGVKKQDLLNRNAKAKSFSIEIGFEVKGKSYVATTVRGATQTVKLFCDGEDISGHTATTTLEYIKDALGGLDHKTFTQIVSQSDPFSLDFLTSTDSARKKFLVSLFALEQYTDIGDRIKSDLKDVTSKIAASNTYISAISSNMDIISKKLAKTKMMEPIVVPEMPVHLAEDLAKKTAQLKDIISLNTKINSNNLFIERCKAVPQVLPEPTTNIVDISAEIKNIESSISYNLSVISGAGSLESICRTCKRPIDVHDKVVLVKEAEESNTKLRASLKVQKELLAAAQLELSKYRESVAALNEWEKLKNTINQDLPTQPYDKDELQAEIDQITKEQSEIQLAIQAATRHNKLVLENNTSIEVNKATLEELTKDRDNKLPELNLLMDREISLSTLVKALGPTGFISYKLDHLTSDLETLVNEYLVDIAGGSFQIRFELGSTDKLNVVIEDKGHDVDIFSLSKGEKARVHIATLLAIRKLIMSISKTSTNLLILDETIDSLDVVGKGTLIDILLKEQTLNTIIISHAFSHPLLAKIEVVKRDDISRLE